MDRTAPAAAQGSLRPAVGRPRPPSRPNVAQQVRDQRRGYAHRVLAALARTQQGRPSAQVRRVLGDSLTPLGIRLPAATLHRLAADITAGRPVDLP